jgi:hypothetical protein
MLVGNRDAGGYMNKDLMDDQSPGTKGDKLVRGQATIFAQLLRLRDAG